VIGPDHSGGLANLLGALSIVRKTGRATRLVVFGTHDAQQTATMAACQEQNLDILRVREEQSARASLQECDILVSLREGTSLLVLQAMSLRIPVITAAIRVPEVVQHQRTALLIRNNENSLSKAILELAARTDRRLIIGVAAAEGVAKQYSETNLWGEYPAHGAVEHESKGRWLVKKALFGAISKSQLFRRGNLVRGQIALTIDDGPDPIYTPRILDICRDYGVRATFFVVGGCAEQYPEIVRRMAEEGHEVGNHSYSHPYFHRLSWSGAREEIEMTCVVLDRILGKKCRLFRPPFGKLSLRSLIPAWEAGQHVVMFNVDLKDYCARAGEVEAKAARTSFCSGDIILYHGISEAALQALPHVIEAALASGRKATTVSELIQA
jgi:peptidoglycan/xylan/chitin deacetylase (PgdA/CDA1 family)